MALNKDTKSNNTDETVYLEDSKNGLIGSDFSDKTTENSSIDSPLNNQTVALNKPKKEEITANIESLAKDNKVKKKPKKTLFIILGALLAILIITGGVYGYFYYQDNEYNKQIALGNQYLDEENYSDAVIAFTDAIKISDKKVEGYEGLAKADTYVGDLNGANEAYLQAYSITDNSFYQNRANAIFYGNTNGNVVNGGNVVEQVDTSYILENGVTQANIWKEKDGKQDLKKTIPIEDKPVENLNIQGRDLYYLNNGKLYSFNLDTDEENTFDIDNILEYLIYSNRIYILTDNALISATIDGTDEKELIRFDAQSFKFIYEDNVIYLATTNSDKTNSKLYSISVDSPELIELYSNETSVITGLIYRDEKILFKLTSSSTAQEALYQLDPSTKKVVELIQPGIISSINVDDENLFYIANKTLYKADLDGSNETEISEIPEQATTEYYTYEVNSINITTENVYVINSVSEDQFSNIGYRNDILTTSIDNLSQLDSVVLSGNTEELVDPEPAIPKAYEEVLDQYRIAMNGGTPSLPSLQYNYFMVSSNSKYALVDLDYNGVNELLINYGYGDSAVDAIYTISDGKAVAVASTGAAGYGYSLTTDNQIREDTSGSYISILKLTGTKLTEVIEFEPDDNMYPSKFFANGRTYTMDEIDNLFPYINVSYEPL